MYSATLESAALVQIHPTVAHLCRARSRRSRQSRRVPSSGRVAPGQSARGAPAAVGLPRTSFSIVATPRLARRAAASSTPPASRVEWSAHARDPQADHPSERNWLAQFHARHPAPRRTAVTCRAVSCWPARRPRRRGAERRFPLMSCQLSSSATRLTTGTSSPGASE